MSARAGCPHVAVGTATLAWLSSAALHAAVNDGMAHCAHCAENRPGALWACLTENCLTLGCGREASKHMHSHARAMMHPVAVHLATGRIWCYSCDDQVLEASYDSDSAAARVRAALTNGADESDDVDMQVVNDVTERALAARRAQRAKRGPESNRGLCGLRNVGNTCFLNSAVQCIAHIPLFARLLLDVAPSLYDHTPAINARYRQQRRLMFVQHFLELLKRIHSGSCDVADPLPFVTDLGQLNPMFRGWEQQDAQEALRCILDNFHEELKFVDRRQSVVSHAFRGSLMSRVTCQTCNRVSPTVDDFFDLSVSIPSPKDIKRMRSVKTSLMGSIASMLGLSGSNITLMDCLGSFFSPESLTGSEMYTCESCRSKQPSVKQFWIESLPEVLCVHIKRFRHQSLFGSKISTSVAFPLENLDLSPFLTEAARSSGASSIYRLRGVVNHHGSLGGGHYTSYCLNQQEWFKFDDSRVSRATPASVQGSEAYVLFYQRFTPKRSAELERFRAIEERAAPKTQLLSRLWYLLWKHSAAVGPVPTFDAVISRQGITWRDATERGTIQADLFRPVSDAGWKYLADLYGVDAEVVLDAAPKAQAQDDSHSVSTSASAASHAAKLDQRREYEREMVTGLDTLSVPANEYWYIIHADWLSSWRDFISKRGPLPGPISNQLLLDLYNKPRPGLVASQDYRGVNRQVWEFLASRYGGGPVICRRQLDLYSA